MEEWKECKLKDICDYEKDKTEVSSLDNSTYISTENMLPNRAGVTTATTLPTGEYTPSFEIDDTLVSNIRPYFKKIWQATFSGGCSADVLVFKAKENISKDYLYYVLTDDEFFKYSMATSKGTKMPRGDKTSIMNYPVKLPPLPTQQKIAAILSSLDDKIELNNKINTNLEQQAGALFKNWFVDDASELIENEIGKMDILITDYVANGSFKDLADNVKYLSNETDNVLIRLTDYNNNFSSDMVYISDESYNFLEKSKLFGDEIIISNVGANVGTVFRCPRLNKKMSLAPNSIMIRGGIYEHYLYLYFTSNYGQGLLKSIVTGSAQPKFNKTNFRSLKIKIPREEKLKKFNSVYDSLYEKIINNQNENIHLTSLRNTLLPKLMNGEININ